MTRMPSLYELLTGIDLSPEPSVDPRKEALKAHIDAVLSKDTRRQCETWKALFEATTRELAGKR